MGLSRFGTLVAVDSAYSEPLTFTPQLFSGWTAANDGPGVNADLTTNSLNIKVPGNYFVYCSLSFLAHAAINFTLQIYLNGAATDYRGTACGAGELLNVAIMGPLDLNEGDRLQLYVFADTALGGLLQGDYGQFGVVSL